jgi:hypothetical protein
MKAQHTRAKGRALLFAARGAMLRVVVFWRDAKYVVALDANAVQRRLRRAGVAGRFARPMLGRRLIGSRFRAHAEILAQRLRLGFPQATASRVNTREPDAANSVLAASLQAGIASAQIGSVETGPPQGGLGCAAPREIC